MKKRESIKKLFLTRQTVANLNDNELKIIQGLGPTCPLTQELEFRTFLRCNLPSRCGTCPIEEP